MSHSLKNTSFRSYSQGLFNYSLTLLFLFATTTMAEPVSEAHQIALETSGELLAPEALIQRVDKDLKAIRKQHPDVAEVHHTNKWQPGKVVINDAKKEDLDKISTTSYGPSEAKAIFQDKIFLLTFTKPYNPEKISEILKSEFGISKAHPDGIIGGSSQITLTTEPSGKNTYVFMKGSGDCFAGCINKHFWTFTVDPNEKVELIEERDGNAGGQAGAMGAMGMGLAAV